jgi:hypothetical protein
VHGDRTGEEIVGLRVPLDIHLAGQNHLHVLHRGKLSLYHRLEVIDSHEPV